MCSDWYLTLFYSLSSSGAMVFNTSLAGYPPFMDSLVEIIQVGLTLPREGFVVILELAVVMNRQTVIEF